MKKTPLERDKIKTRTEETGLYRKKSQTSTKSDSKKRTDHKHKYEPVIIADRVFTAISWGSRCSVCGRIRAKTHFASDRDFVKPAARSKNRQCIPREELLSIPEIRVKYLGIDILGIDEELPAKENGGLLR